MLVPNISKYYIVYFIEIYYIQILFMKFTCKDILLSQFSTLFFAIRNKSNTKFLKSYFSNSDHHNIL